MLLLGATVLTGCGPRESEQGGNASLSSGASSNSSKTDTSGKDRQGASGDGTKERAPTLVRVGKLFRDKINSSIEVSADIEAEFQVIVYPKVGPAYIEERLVDEGDPVKAGEPLLRLDDIDFLIAKRRADSKLLQAQQTKIQRLVQLNEAKARERAQKAVADRALADRERALNAMKGDIDVLSGKELKDTEADWLQSVAELEASKLAVQRAESEQAMAELEVDAARIEQEAAQNDLEQTVVRSPIDGVVQQRLVNTGLLINTSNQLFTIIDPTRLIANLRIPQEDLQMVRGTGMSVEFRFDALPERVFHGKVEAINPAVDPSSGLAKVRVRLDDEAAGQVLPGMFSRALIIIESRDNALMLNKRAVVYDEGETWFFTVEDGFARRHGFQPGASTENEVEVVAVDGAPLMAGDDAQLRSALDLQIITVGQDRLRDGDPVKVAEESS